FKTAMPQKIAVAYRCAPDSPYAPLVSYLRDRSQRRLEEGDDPRLVAELIADIAESDSPAFRYPAGAQAERIVRKIPELDAAERERFIREVQGTGWWSAESPPS
ncbi:MAG: hypothetical protein ACREUU_08980, partial [Gammaproteobacteria bacterium]